MQDFVLELKEFVFQQILRNGMYDLFIASHMALTAVPVSLGTKTLRVEGLQSQILSQRCLSQTQPLSFQSSHFLTGA